MNYANVLGMRPRGPPPGMQGPGAPPPGAGPNQGNLDDKVVL